MKDIVNYQIIQKIILKDCRYLKIKIACYDTKFGNVSWEKINITIDNNA